MIDKLYKIVKIVIGIFLAIFLGNKLDDYDLNRVERDNKDINLLVIS